MNANHVGREIRKICKAGRVSIEGLTLGTRIDEPRLRRIESAGAVASGEELISIAHALAAPADTLARWLTPVLLSESRLDERGREYVRQALAVLGADACGLPLSPAAIHSAAGLVRQGLSLLDAALAGRDVANSAAAQRLPPGSVPAVSLTHYFDGGRAAAAAWAVRLHWALRSDWSDWSAGVQVSGQAYLPCGLRVGAIGVQRGRRPQLACDVQLGRALGRVLDNNMPVSVAWRESIAAARKADRPFLPYRTFRRWTEAVKQEIIAAGRWPGGGA